MSDSRRAPRYVTCASLEGHTRVLQDVLVERLGDERVVVVAHAPAPIGEALTVQVCSAGARLTSYEGRVVASIPILRGGIVRFRIELDVDRRIGVTVATPPWESS